MNIYQVHYITDITPKNTNIPIISHIIKYCIADSPTKAKLALFPNKPETDECYTLKVSKETLKDEILHSKEIINFWKNQPSDFKLNYNVIIKRQQNLIKHYNKLIKELQ